MMLRADSFKPMLPSITLWWLLNEVDEISSHPPSVTESQRLVAHVSNVYLHRVIRPRR